MLNKDFYPTPKPIIKKMVEKIQGTPDHVLEPSAGKGDIIDYLSDDRKYRHRGCRYIAAIEIDPDLRATLIGKRIKVIDTDFLTYAGPDKFDLIIANPPFSEGARHLLKAIDIMYRGEIVFLLNAETIRNPHSNIRKELGRKLVELNADIEFIENAFILAERKTHVEVALIYIKIERNVEDDLFKDVDDTAEDLKPQIEEIFEVSNRKTIQELVAEYNQIVNIGVQTITDYFRNYKKIGYYIGLNKESGKDYSDGDMTDKMQGQVNDLVHSVRTAFWRKTLDLKEVRNRLTSKKRNEFEDVIKIRCDMDFTESNIRQFVINLINGYKDTLTDSVLEIFDKFTIKHSYGQLPDEQNIHYFNGWKTNKAFQVNKKVIVPIYGGYDGPFTGYGGKWDLDYSAQGELRDIDIVMNYFDGAAHYNSLINVIERAFSNNKSRNIISSYFKVNCYKKGTIHLTFRDDDILRRFNVAACLGKKWLPFDYGTKPFADLNREEKETAESFEGRESYIKNLNRPVFADKNNPMITHEEPGCLKQQTMF